MATRVLSSLAARWVALRRFVTRASPRARDVVAVLVSAVCGLSFAISLGGRHSALWATTVGLLCLIAAGLLWWRRAHPVAVTLVTIAINVVTGLPVALAFAVITLAIRRRDRVLLAVVATAYLTDVVRSSLVGDTLLSTIVGSALVWAALVAFGAYIGARRDLVESLRQRAETAEAERELRATQARLGERTRIAQEMHDVLAHQVSLIALHAGGLEVNPAAGAEQVERTAALVRATAREALEDLRGVLGVLRTDSTVAGADLAPQPGLDGIAALVDASRAAGIEIVSDRDLHGQPPAVVARTAYRVVQEALTNVHKHARSAATTVRLTGRAGDGLLVEVLNRVPVAAASLLPGAGVGLVGLGERVDVLGGRLESGQTTEGGWRVRAWLPWDEEQTR